MSDDPVQQEVFALLADPASHGPGNGQSGVKRVTTHVSEVFLTDDWVYKVKRAVRYAFLDFSEPEARRKACEAELRLNSRTAPEIYEAVVAIRRRPDGGLTLEGEGEPVEWAVKMHRFDESMTLDRLAERGALRAEWVDGLVDALVALHAEAEVRQAPYGGAEGLRRIVDDNAEDMKRVGDILPPERVEPLIARTRAALEANAALLDARRAAGLVRRCHGDLHLANVVLWQGRPTPFDCIEFSESIGSIDVAYDFAFLLMDLEVRGLRALAGRALSRWFGRQGGLEVLAALPLMLSLRAGVRAKVTAMAVGSQAEPAEAERLAGEALRFLQAAERFLEPGGPLRLLAVGGLSGSGKTTLAAALAPDLDAAPGALHLRSDLIRKRLAGVLPEERLPPESYGPEANHRVYETLLRDTEAALAAGRSAIVDAVFAREEERAAAEALAQAAGASFEGLWLEAPAEALRGRVAARRGDASDATEAVVEQQLGYDIGALTWHRLEAADGPEAVLEQARALLGLR